jgi:putative transposase
MPRMPRNIQTDSEGRYHLRGQAAGRKHSYPFQNRQNAAQLNALIRHFTGLFFCRVASVSILGNHYHLVCVFEAFRKLSRQQLWRIAERFYPDPKYQPYLRWNDGDWERFNRRLFNVSELMRNLQSAYARWFNRRHQRKGRFWADRFQSTESDNLQETVFYVDLNAVRAHLVARPEQWRYSSAWMRRHGHDDWLMPLPQLMGGFCTQAEAERSYWTLLYWRGTRSKKDTGGNIPVEVAQRMEREGYPRGCYLQSIPAFSRGRVVGTFETVRQSLDQCRAAGLYSRRKNPVPLGVGNLFALREQRRNFVPI